MRQGRSLGRKAFSIARKAVWSLALTCVSACAGFAQNPTSTNSPAGSALLAVQEPPAQESRPIAHVPEAQVNINASNDFFGRNIAQITFKGIQSTFAESRLHSALQLKSNEALDRNKLRSSIRELYRTGRFANVAVDGSKLPSGDVAIEFILRENYFNGSIEVTGRPKHGPSDTQLITASKIELGTLYSPERVQQALTSMTRVLEDFGFYQTSIAYEEVPHPETQQMDIIFRISAGPVARIGQLSVTGNPGITAEEVRKISKMHPGKPVRNGAVSKAIQRLRKKYTKQNRLEAQISVVDREYDASTNSVNYTFDIQRGPTVEIVAEGAKLSRSQMKKYVPVFEENAVDEDLLNEGRRNIRDHLQTKGYFNSKVQVNEEHDAIRGRLNIVYEIDRGTRHKLTNISIEGNKYFSTRDLRDLMVTQPSSPLLPYGRFSQSLVNRDVDSIRAMYQNNGFANAKVISEIQDDCRGKKGQMCVLIKVEEGAQTRVNTLTLIGSQLIDQNELRSMLTTVDGQPFSEANVGQDRTSIVNYYFDEGFSDVQVETSAKPVPGEPTRMDVSYKITEGKRVYVDRVLVSGVENTRRYVVNREFQIRDGAPMSLSRVVDSQRKLYDLGIFNEVNTAVQNPDGEAPFKNLLFNLKEARRWTFNYGLGIEFGTGADQGQGSGPQGNTGVSPRASLDVTRLNFRGRDESVVFKSTYGRFAKRALLSFDSPRWYDLPNWRLTLSAFYDNSRDVNTFASERIEGNMQWQQFLSKSTQLLYRMSYRRVRVDPSSFPAGFSPDLIPLYSRPVRVGIPSLTFIRDRRDSPIDSTKGSYNTADFGVASGIFGSEANYTNIVVQNSTYHRIRTRSSSAGRNLVLARNTRIGVEIPYGKNDFVPLPERFFVGGSNSLRGFAINQAGPRDPSTGGPVGGNAMFVNNIELRLPPTALPYVGENVNFVFFHDMGNGFTQSRDMWKNLFRWSQKDKAACRDLSTAAVCDLNYVSHSVGAGIRYKTPIGPIRIDYGYNLNPPLFPIKDGTPTRSETLRRSNFFFSIGQTF